MPDEYVELLLCREWSCTPSQLRREALPDIITTLTVLDQEAKFRKKLQK